MDSEVIQKYLEEYSFKPENTVLVENLHPEATDRMISLYFGNICFVTKFKIFESWQTGLIGNCCFVELECAGSIEEVIERVDLVAIKKWEVRIRPLKNVKDSENRIRVLVENVPKDTTSKELKEALGIVGNVITAGAERKINGESFGIFFVEYANIASASAALAVSKSILMFKRKLKLSILNNPVSAITYGKCMVIVTFDCENLTKFDKIKIIIDDIIKGKFGACYKVLGDTEKDIQLKNMAFISFATNDHRQYVLEMFKNGHITIANKMKVAIKLELSDDIPDPQKQRLILSSTPSNIIVIDYLKPDIDIKHLRSVFKKFGPVLEVKIENLREINVGFIEFVAIENAIRTCNEHVNNPDLQALVANCDKGPFIKYL